MIKRPNLSCGVEENAETQSKGIENFFNEALAKTFPNLEKDMNVPVQEAFTTPNTHGQNRTSPYHITVKMPRG